MNPPKVASFGSWKSPITSDLIVSQTIGISSVAINHENIFWLEKRPQEQGRSVIAGLVNQREAKNLTPSPFSVRSQIHEYGGGAYTVEQNIIYFSNYKDGRIYQQVIGTQPHPLTDELPHRYGDMVVDRERNRLICVCEAHLANAEPQNSIIGVNIDTGKIQNLINGA